MGVSEGGEGEDTEGVKEEVEDVQGSHAHPRPWDLLWSHGPPQGLQVYRPTHTNDIKYADIMIRLSTACWRLTDNRVLNIL